MRGTSQKKRNENRTKIEQVSLTGYYTLGASRSRLLLELCDSGGVTNSYQGFAPIQPPVASRSLQEQTSGGVTNSYPDFAPIRPSGASRSFQEPLGADFCWSSVTVAVLPTPTQALRRFGLQESSGASRSLQKPPGASRSRLLLELCDSGGVTNSYPGFAPIRPTGASRSRILLELCDSSGVTNSYPGDVAGARCCRSEMSRGRDFLGRDIW